MAHFIGEHPIGFFVFDIIGLIALISGGLCGLFLVTRALPRDPPPTRYFFFSYHAYRDEMLVFSGDFTIGYSAFPSRKLLHDRVAIMAGRAQKPFSLHVLSIIEFSSKADADAWGAEEHSTEKTSGAHA